MLGEPVGAFVRQRAHCYPRVAPEPKGPHDLPMANADAQALLEEGTLSYALGDSEIALKKLDEALQLDDQMLDAWHAKAEIHLARRDLDEALEAGEKALALNDQDIHTHTTLSRIWMERGDKEKAEHHGAQARMLGWKEQLKEEPEG